MIKARCPKCGQDAELDDSATRVRCSCGYDADYETYLESMKERVDEMAFDYIPDRPGM